MIMELALAALASAILTVILRLESRLIVLNVKLVCKRKQPCKLKRK